MTPEAVLFDMDGLLVDSEPTWRRVETAVLGRLGVPLTDALCEGTKGLRIEEVVQHWRERFPWRGPSNMDVVREVLDGVVASLRAAAEPKPGVAHAIAVARGAGLRLALASSSHLEVIRAVLERLALADAFEVICSGEAEPYGKPHPGIFLSAAKELGLAPVRCVVLEDSLPGVIAAKAARMRCVAVPETPAAGFAVADAVLPSLAALTPADLGLA